MQWLQKVVWHPTARDLTRNTTASLSPLTFYVATNSTFLKNGILWQWKLFSIPVIWQMISSSAHIIWNSWNQHWLYTTQMFVVLLSCWSHWLGFPLGKMLQHLSTMLAHPCIQKLDSGVWLSPSVHQRWENVYGRIMLRWLTHRTVRGNVGEEYSRLFTLWGTNHDVSVFMVSNY